MKNPSSKADRRTALSLVEEATHLLRRVPVSGWLMCYLGGLPFVAYLFFFWSDMSRSAVAGGRLLESSLILAFLYWVMKVGQALYCDHLMRLVEGRHQDDEPPEPLPLRGWLRLLASQAWIHATMPWVLVLASAAVLPFAWAYAFYHNVTALAVSHFRKGGRTQALANLALEQSHYQPLQNHALMLMLTVLAILIYLNLFAFFALGATLAKSFTGSENPFTMHPMLYLSTSLQALLISASYLVMNPLVKALYVLRCFYGAARKNGADLQVRLRQLQSKAVLLLLVLLLGSGLSPVQAAPPAAPAAAPLERNIQDVLQGSEYQWRLPRDSAAKPSEDTWLGATIREVVAWLEGLSESIGNALGDIMDWLFGGKEGEPMSKEGKKNSLWLAMLPKLLIGLLVLLVLGLIWMLYRNWQQARATEPVEAAAAPPEINLENEQVIASQLPENEWLRLAREQLEAGELRLALRALFLATLAHLGEKKLLQISRSKSNGDYVRELSWRARERQALHEGFTAQVRIFDRVWYGWHEVNAELMTRFEQQHQHITSHAR